MHKRSTKPRGVRDLLLAILHPETAPDLQALPIGLLPFHHSPREERDRDAQLCIGNDERGVVLPKLPKQKARHCCRAFLV
jgi:hypothetical protein